MSLPNSFKVDGVRYSLLNTQEEYCINGDPSNKIPGHEAKRLYKEIEAKARGLLNGVDTNLLDREWEVVSITNEKTASNEFSFWNAPIKTRPPDTRPPASNMTILQLNGFIKGEKLKKVTETGRNLYQQFIKDGNKNNYSKFKTGQLPYVCFSGRFKYRNEVGLIDHSGFLQVDIDGLKSEEEVNSVKNKLLSDTCIDTDLLFTSISGHGVKCIVSIDPSQCSQGQYVLAIQSYLRNTYHIEIDSQCKDVARACFLSWDPDCYINPKYLDPC